MNPVEVIKKNAGWYLIRIIVTGVAAFAGVILTKRLLLPSDFLDFNLLANGVTLLNSILIAWFGQSIIRFYHSYHYFFRVQNIVFISTANFLLVGLPVFFVWKWLIGIDSYTIFPLAFMMLNALYSALLLLFQAAHKAKIVAVAETIRSIVIIVGLFIPQFFDEKVGANYFWLVWIVSSFISTVCLFYLRKVFVESKAILNDNPKETAQESNAMIMNKVVKFGLPLSAWVFISFLLINADKWYVYKAGVSVELAANYVAISDIMMRGTGFLFSPIVSSAYPVISGLFDKGKGADVRKIVLKVILWQTLLGIGAIVGFAVLFPVVFKLLGIQADSFIFVYGGLVMIALNTLWHVSAMFQKVAELGIETIKLFWALCVASLAVYLCYYLAIKPASLIGVIAVSSVGYLIYFLYTYWLFATFKWKEKNETV
jgi:O-antigen/teichoic acid export membrane protein